MNACIIKHKRLGTVFGQKKRPVKISDHRTLRDQCRRRHSQRRSDHTADHNVIALLERLILQCQRLGQAAGFVQFDVYDVIFTGKLRKAFP